MSSDVALLIPGHVGRRYTVLLTTRGTTFHVDLTGRAFTVLADLLLARLECPHSGRSTLPSIDDASRTTAVYDLRTTIDDALEVDGVGHTLVQSTHWGEYSLDVSAHAIRVGPAFRDLAPRHLAEPTVLRILAALDAIATTVPSEVSDFVSAP